MNSNNRINNNKSSFFNTKSLIKTNKRLRIKKGFTLVELVVVIAVIAVLAGVSVAAYYGISDKAQKSNVESLTKQVSDAYTMYQVENPYTYSNEASIYEYADTFISSYLKDDIGLDNTKVNFAVFKSLDNKENVTYNIDTLSNEDSNVDQKLVIFVIDKYASYLLIDGEDASLENTDNYSTIFNNLSESISDISTSYTLDTSKVVDENDLIMHLRNDVYEAKKITLKYNGSNELLYGYNGQRIDEVLPKEDFTGSITISGENIYTHNPKTTINGVEVSGDTIIDYDELTNNGENVSVFEVSKAQAETILDLMHYPFMADNVTYNGMSGLNFYGNFDEVMNFLNDVSNKDIEHNIYVGADATISQKTVAMPEKTSIYLVYDVLNPLITKTGFITDSRTLKDENKTTPSKLTIKSGVNFEINNILYLAGIITTSTSISSGNSGIIFLNTSTINLEENSKIVANNNAKIYVYGNITGKGEVSLNEGSYLRRPLSILDWPGGAFFNGMSQNEVFPFNKYNFEGFSYDTKLRINYGARLDIEAAVEVQNLLGIMRLKFVGNNDDDQQDIVVGEIGSKKSDPVLLHNNSNLFSLVNKSDYLTFSFEDADKNLEKLEKDNVSNFVVLSPKRNVISIYGDINDNYIKELNLVESVIPKVAEEMFGGLGPILTGLLGGADKLADLLQNKLNMTVDFSWGFPIYNIAIKCFGDSEITLDNNAYKFLPGSYVQLNDETFAEINSKTLFYKTFNYLKTINSSINHSFINRKNISDECTPAYIEFNDSSSAYNEDVILGQYKANGSFDPSPSNPDGIFIIPGQDASFNEIESMENKTDKLQFMGYTIKEIPSANIKKITDKLTWEPLF